MCVGRLRLGCRELHAGELHTWALQAGQVEVEAFLTTDQTSKSCGGGDSSLPHYGRAVQRGWWSSCVCG